VSNKNEEATLPTCYQIRKRRYQLSLIQAVSVRPFVILFHQFHNKILQSSLKTFHEPRRANQNVHMANLFHGLRKHTIVSNTVIRPLLETIATERKRVGVDISTKMTCAEFVVRHDRMQEAIRFGERDSKSVGFPFP